jgi:LysM repeat protein
MTSHSGHIRQWFIASGLTVALLGGCATIDDFMNKGKTPEAASTEEVSTDKTDVTPTDTTTTDSPVVENTPVEVPTTTTPSDTTSNSSSDEDAFHTIVKGDSLYKIAKKYNCSIKDLVTWNKFKNERQLLLPGQKIRVSAP